MKSLLDTAHSPAQRHLLASAQEGPSNDFSAIDETARCKAEGVNGWIVVPLNGAASIGSFNQLVGG